MSKKQRRNNIMKMKMWLIKINKTWKS